MTDSKTERQTLDTAITFSSIELLWSGSVYELNCMAQKRVKVLQWPRFSLYSNYYMACS